MSSRPTHPFGVHDACVRFWRRAKKAAAQTTPVRYRFACIRNDISTYPSQWLYASKFRCQTVRKLCARKIFSMFFNMVPKCRMFCFVKP
jgi:hypothetical protein